MNYDFLIVGSGITGMNLALKLKKNYKNKEILLVDSSNIFGFIFCTLSQSRVNKYAQFDSTYAIFFRCTGCTTNVFSLLISLIIIS